jgi:hypothetical protein
MIASLVMPQTPLPEITELHRRNLTLVWEAVYYPSSRDKTAYGVNITVCRSDVVIASQAQGLLPLASSLDDDKVSHCRIVTKEKQNLLEVLPTEGEDKEAYRPQILSTHLQDLDPSVEYRIRSLLSPALSDSRPSDSQPSTAMPGVCHLHLQQLCRPYQRFHLPLHSHLF